MKKFLVFGVFVAVAIAIACADNPGNPASPSVTGSVAAAAGPAGETLKASAPSPVSPVNGVRLDSPDVRLVIANSSTAFASDVPLTYRFEVSEASGNVVHTSGLIAAGSGSTSYSVPTQLNADQTYQWRAQAVYQGADGPWSARASFIAAADGYIRGNELYDPLVNGKTVGTIHGDVSFVPGLGVKLNSQLAYISYQLPQTLTEGEFSIIVTNLFQNTEGGKTKLFAMSSGFCDITLGGCDLITNDRRMTVEKRGDPDGTIAWRFITHDDQVDTEGPERRGYPFKENLTYFWQATWRSNVFRVLIRENNTNGVDGREIYNFPKQFDGRAYDPNPHFIYIGAPVGRSGVDAASVDRVIIRQVWVSSRPRPAFANK